MQRLLRFLSFLTLAGWFLCSSMHLCGADRWPLALGWSSLGPLSIPLYLWILPTNPFRSDCLFQSTEILDVHTCVLSCFCCVWLFVTLWTVTCQTPPSTGFSRQEYWGGLPCPSPGDLPDSEPKSLTSPALAGGFFTTSATWEAWNP